MTTSATKLLQDLLRGKLALDYDEARILMAAVVGGEMCDSEIAAFLTTFCLRTIGVTEICAFRDELLSRATPLALEASTIVDVCGTGGDGKNTINISTLAAFVLSACGVAVVKHGNYSASSVFGSSNLLQGLGISFVKDAQAAQSMFAKTKLLFLHAPDWHPALRRVAPVRKILKVRTIFNILGPLLNPARPSHQLIGVTNENLQDLLAASFIETPTCAAVVNSEGGYDEVSLTANFSVVSRAGRKIFSSQDFGLAVISPDALNAPATIAELTAAATALLQGKGSNSAGNVIAANAAVALQLVQPERRLSECFEACVTAIASGAAYQKLQEVRKACAANENAGVDI